jgi:hypothetical protein
MVVEGRLRLRLDFGLILFGAAWLSFVRIFLWCFAFSGFFLLLWCALNQVKVVGPSLFCLLFHSSFGIHSRLGVFFGSRVSNYSWFFGLLLTVVLGEPPTCRLYKLAWFLW